MFSRRRVGCVICLHESNVDLAKLKYIFETAPKAFDVGSKVGIADYGPFQQFPGVSVYLELEEGRRRGLNIYTYIEQHSTACTGNIS